MGRVLCLNKHFGGAERYSKEPSKLSISAVARVLTKRFSVSLCNSPVSVFVPPLIHIQNTSVFFDLVNATFLCRFLTAVCCQILLEYVWISQEYSSKSPQTNVPSFALLVKVNFVFQNIAQLNQKNSQKKICITALPWHLRLC